MLLLDRLIGAQGFNMLNVPFSKPVSVFVGLGFPREVNDVLEAYKVLNEWPESGRGAAHLMALHTCAAVLGGHGTTLDASEAFKAFAADRGILAPEAQLAQGHGVVAGDHVPGHHLHGPASLLG